MLVPEMTECVVHEVHSNTKGFPTVGMGDMGSSRVNSVCTWPVPIHMLWHWMEKQCWRFI